MVAEKVEIERLIFVDERWAREHLPFSYVGLGAEGPEGLLVRASQPGSQHHLAF